MGGDSQSLGTHRPRLERYQEREGNTEGGTLEGNHGDNGIARAADRGRLAGRTRPGRDNPEIMGGLPHKVGEIQPDPK